MRGIMPAYKNVVYPINSESSNANSIDLFLFDSPFRSCFEYATSIITNHNQYRSKTNFINVPLSKIIFMSVQISKPTLPSTRFSRFFDSDFKLYVQSDK